MLRIKKLHVVHVSNKDRYQHYHYDMFNLAIDFQLEELNSRFSDGTTKLLILSSILELKDNFKSFKVDAICKLIENFYPENSNE